MKFFARTALVLTAFSVFSATFTTTAYAGRRPQPPSVQAPSGDFPLGPDPKLTTGALCDRPDAFRYPEHVAYCTRDVKTETKVAVIRQYDQQLGFKIQSYNRADFKIDHYFPLCAGGSNEAANLWPQHKSVYEITDPLEPEICGKMASGKLKQADAIKLIMQAKAHLDQVGQILAHVQSL